MLCPTCRRGISRLLPHIFTSRPSPSSVRTIATVPATPNAAPSTPPQPPKSETPDQSSGATDAQPYSEPFFPSSMNTPNTPIPSKPQFVSSCAGGTPLSSLMFLKQPPKPLIALEDHEYPAWLWTLIADPNAPKAVTGGVDLSGMTKKTRAKYERKMAKLQVGLEKPVPVHEQAKDLTVKGEGAEVHMERQKELTGSMRQARRKGIREANFLRSM